MVEGSCVAGTAGKTATDAVAGGSTRAVAVWEVALKRAGFILSETGRGLGVGASSKSLSEGVVGAGAF